MNIGGVEIRQWSGGTITEPGIYAGVPMWAYHGQLTDGPSVSSSGLRDIFHKSPRHYFRNSYLNPNRKPSKVSEAFIFGRAAHHLLLGESEFRKHFAVRPLTYPADCDTLTPPFWPPEKPWSGNANWCRAWLAVAEFFGFTILTPGDIAMIRAMADALADEPLVQAGILNGLIELSFVWRDPESGIWLKWRPDAVPTDDMNFSDLKTCMETDDRSLERSITKFGYNQQAALGAWACDTILKREMESFSLVFVEKSDSLPCVRTKTVRTADVALGVRQNRAALQLFKWSLENGKWLGPGGEQHDHEFSGLNDRATEQVSHRIEEIERLIA